jgi:hypothetical protein
MKRRIAQTNSLPASSREIGSNFKLDFEYPFWLSLLEKTFSLEDN